MTEKNGTEADPRKGAGAPSREVNWWATHVFVAALVAQLDEPLPAAGTPQWCSLASGDPRKLLALAIAGEHWVLRQETVQDELAETSKFVAATENWGRISNAILSGRGDTYIPRKAS